jgi:NAD dependent epimerase/dehydratase family enzyme
MLPVVTRIAKLGGAGKLGNGQQHWPWISVNDYCLALLHLVQSPLSGPVNMTAPVSSTAAEFMRTLAAVVHRPYLLPAPAFALKALLGEAADELLLSNQPVHPSQLLSSGFSFSDTDLHSVLTRLLR